MMSVICLVICKLRGESRGFVKSRTEAVGFNLVNKKQQMKKKHSDI